MQDFTNISKAISTLDGILEKHPGDPPHIGHEGSPGQDSHGRRLTFGIGSRATLISVLSAARDVGHDIPSRGQLDASSDGTLWNLARDLTGSEEKAVAMIAALPERKHGEALRAGDVKPGLINRFLGSKPRSAGLLDAPVPKPVRGSRKPKPRLSASPSRAENNLRIKQIGLRPVDRPGTKIGKQLLGSNKQTKGMYVRSGKYTEERLNLHTEIMFTMLDGRTPKENPKARIVAGGQGSDLKAGVSLLPTEARTDWVDSVQINPARIAQLIPEYEQMAEAGDAYAAQAVHEESLDIAYRLFEMAREMRFNVTVHGSGGDDPQAMDAVISQLKAAGYEVNALLVQMDPETAVASALDAAFGSGPDAGRIVPPDALRESHTRAAEGFAQWQRNPALSSFTVIDTTGKKPVVVAEGGGGRPLDVYDPDLFADLADLGGFDPDEVADIPERARVDRSPRLSPGLPEPASLPRGADVPKEDGYVHFLGSLPEIQEIIFDGEIPLPEVDEAAGEKARIFAADDPNDLWDDAPRAVAYGMLRFRDENVGTAASGDRFVERPVTADQLDVYTKDGWQSLTTIKGKEEQRASRFSRIKGSPRRL